MWREMTKRRLSYTAPPRQRTSQRQVMVIRKPRLPSDGEVRANCAASSDRGEVEWTAAFAVDCFRVGAVREPASLQPSLNGCSARSAARRAARLDAALPELQLEALLELEGRKHR